MLELIKGLAADIGEPIDKEASHQIRRKTYVDDGLGGGTREQVNRFRGELVDGNYTGTIPQILGLVNLKLKVMIASGDENEEQLEILGDKVLGHTWKPTADVLVFRVNVNLTPAKLKKKTDAHRDNLREVDIPRLPSIVLTKRVLLGFVNGQYDPMGLIAPLLIILKINLRETFATGVDLGWDEAISEEQHAK